MLSQLFTILPIAATVLALPTSSPNPAAELSTRDGEYVYWKYYGDGGCHGDWIDDSALGQGGNIGTQPCARRLTLPSLLTSHVPIGVCTPVTPIAGATSFFVEHNDLTRAGMYISGFV